jgi:hypothetical protein
MSIANIRRDYSGDPLSETESDPDPFAQFARWFEQVRDLEADPTAFALATSTRDGRPSVRAVLLKGVDERGFVFYTNYNSRKARELDDTGRPRCCSTGRRSCGRCGWTDWWRRSTRRVGCVFRDASDREPLERLRVERRAR